METINSALLKIAPLLGALILSACAGEPPMTERNFGDSVRQMITSQTYDPSTLTNPSDEPVDEGDGPLLENTLEVYRTRVAEPGEVVNQIIVGGEGQQ